VLPNTDSPQEGFYESAIKKRICGSRGKTKGTLVLKQLNNLSQNQRPVPYSMGVDLLAGIAPAGNMVIGVLELDAEGTGHGGEGSRGRRIKSRIKI
jgi:hypothetical protein